MVAGIVRRQQLVGMVGIASGFVEVDDAVESAAGSDPGVYGLTIRLRGGREVGRSAEGQDRSSVYLQATSMRADDHLLKGGDQILGGRRLFAVGEGAARSPDVVYAFEHDDPADTGLRDHVAVEARQQVWAEAVAKNAIASDAVVQNRDAGGAYATFSSLSELGITRSQ